MWTQRWFHSFLLITVCSLLISISINYVFEYLYRIESPICSRIETEFVVSSVYRNTYISTSFGKTYIEEWNTGNSNGYNLLFVHGLHGSISFTSSFIPYITGNDYNFFEISINKIISYHLYGHGYTDSVLYPNTILLFVSQLNDIVSIYNLSNLILIGHSFGSQIIVKYTTIYPNKVNKIITFSPSGLTVKLSLIKILLMPIIGDILPHLRITKWILKKVMIDYFFQKEYSFDNDIFLKHKKFYELQLYKHSGFLISLVSIFRHIDLSWNYKYVFDELYHSQNFNASKSWLFIWGMNDIVTPIKNDSLYHDVTFLKLPNTSHLEITEIWTMKQYIRRLFEWIQ